MFESNVISYEYQTKTATTQYQINKAFKDYEGNTCDKIDQDIYNIFWKNNPNFDLSKNLSKYWRDSSQEFFAECFANMVSGKSNELGNAMKEFLEGEL